MSIFLIFWVKMPYYGNDNDLYMKTLHVSINFKYSITLLQKILWDWDHQILLCPFHIFRPKKNICHFNNTKTKDWQKKLKFLNSENLQQKFRSEISFPILWSRQVKICRTRPIWKNPFFYICIILEMCRAK